MSNEDVIRLQKTVMEGVSKVIRAYSLLFSATEKPSAQEHWDDLKNGITLLRRTLSKVEANAYDELTTRFEQVDVAIKSSDSSTSFDSDSSSHSSDEKSPEDVEPLIDDEAVEKSNDSKRSLDSDVEKELFTAINMVSSEFPPPQPFKKGDKFLAKVLSAVSPLEFYVIKVANFRVLSELERLLSYCSEKLCTQSLSDSQCCQNHACLVRFEDILARATIGHGGANEIQVYLVDYGRTMFVNRSDCFTIPKFIAQYTPPLAHYCTLNDVDSRALDHAAVISFHEKILSVNEVTLTCFGESRRTHGELVDLDE